MAASGQAEPALLPAAPCPALTRMFCRFQQISLILTLRSKVTQPRRKNLHEKACEQSLLAWSWDGANGTAHHCPAHLLSGWGSDSATRIKPGYRLQSCRSQGQRAEFTPQLRTFRTLKYPSSPTPKTTRQTKPGVPKPKAACHLKNLNLNQPCPQDQCPHSQK